VHEINNSETGASPDVCFTAASGARWRHSAKRA
jgi:hypothetical protein